MHLALLHDGRPALLRVEGPAGAPAALFFHPFPLHADAWEEMLPDSAARPRWATPRPWIISPGWARRRSMRSAPRRRLSSDAQWAVTPRWRSRGGFPSG